MTAQFQINELVLLKRQSRLLDAKSASNKFKAMTQKRLTPKQVKKHKLKVLKKKKQTERLFDRTIQQASIREINDLTLICCFCGICHDDMSTGSCQCYDSNDYDDDSDYFAANYDSDDERAYGYYLHQHLRSSKDDDRTYGYYMQQHLRLSKTVDHYDSDDSD
jgi:hypothetical protein